MIMNYLIHENTSKAQLAVFCSGGGGNLEYLIKSSKKSGTFRISEVYLDRHCGAEDVAQKSGIPVTILSNKDSQVDYSSVRNNFDLFVLAGYLGVLPPDFCRKHVNKIINVHPSLLPKFGGKGMYGTNVHEAVIASGEQYSGATVHFVTEEVDRGPIVLQQKLEILPEESPWALGGRIFEIEGPLLLRAIEKIV